MTLHDLLTAYLSERTASVRYVESLRRTVRRLAEGGILSTHDLDPRRFNSWLQNLSSPSSTTKANVRREALTLWRYAVETGETDVLPARIVRIKAARNPPEAWSLTELGRLLDCAEKDETKLGPKSKMRICDYMPAWVGASYDTGLRFADMLSLRTCEVRNGFICKVANKTRKPLQRPLSNFAASKLDTLCKRSQDGTVFLWFLTRRRAFLAMRAFLDRNGFHGSGKYLRRSCATYMEKQNAGSATRYLQHSAPHLVRDHYIDETLIDMPSGPPCIAATSSSTHATTY